MLPQRESVLARQRVGRGIYIVFGAREGQLRLMKIATIIARTLLGFAFVFFGVNGIHPFGFMPKPTFPPDSPALHFFMAVGPTGFMKAIALLQLLGGLSLLFNVLPVLGLTILCPIIFNILLFHLTIAPENFAPGIIVAVLALVLVASYWNHYRPIFQQPSK